MRAHRGQKGNHLAGNPQSKSWFYAVAKMKYLNLNP